MRLAALAGREWTAELEDLRASLDPEAPADLSELAALLAAECRDRGWHRLGLSGGQGAGKSTLTGLLVEASTQLGRRCAALSLDDFYLGAAERRALAEAVHPLFATRGPPGTHDAPACLAALLALGEAGPVRVPTFDKGRDDRSGERVLRGPFDLVVLEGWCVGARPAGAEALDEPVNALEAEHDPEGRWRRHSDEQLAGAYAELFAALDALAYLRVPSLDAVRRWRLQQEEERPAARRMDSTGVERFVAHYERITLAMLQSLPERAQVCIDLDEAHRVAGLHFRGSGS